MTGRRVDVVVDGLTFTEAPRWWQGRLWFVDFYTKTVNALADDGTVERIAVVEAQPSGLGWLPDGRMLVVSMKDRRICRLEHDGTLVEHADISHLCGGPANDMVVAPSGCAYVGNFGFDVLGGADFAPTGIVRVEPDGRADVVADGLAFPNGMAISSDGSTLFVNELFGNRVSAFEIGGSGALGPRRDFASFGDLGDERDLMRRVGASTIMPDGLALDAEGAVWVADVLHQRALRLAEGGEILDEITTPPDGVFAMALGGADGRTLFLCVAPDADETARSNARDGRILATEVAVPAATAP